MDEPHDKPPESDRSRLIWLADLSMIATALVWGLNMPIMKFALGRVDPYLFNAVRLLVSAITLGVIVWWQSAPVFDRSPDSKPIRTQLLMIGLFSFFVGFAYQVLFLLGINNTSAGNTALIMSAIPMWTAVMAYFLIKEKLTKFAWVGLVIAMIGTTIVTMTVLPNTGSSNSLLGNVLVSGAAFSWALGSVWSRPIMNTISPLALAFCGVAFATPFHFLVAANGLADFPKFFQDPLLFGAILFSGVLSTGIAYALWNFGVKVLGTSHAAIFQNLVPFIALLASWLMIGEVPAWIQMVGGGIIIVGLVTIRRNR